MVTAASAPPVLYHYTTQAGLIGVLESNAIWATKIHYLNDSSEYELALEIGREVLAGLLSRETDEHRQEKITCLLENLATIEAMNVCVCSFSEHGDLLSQWRACQCRGWRLRARFPCCAHLRAGERAAVCAGQVRL